MRQSVAPLAVSRPLVLTAVALLLLLGGTIMLWARYGTAVFFETIRAGLAACFG